MNKMPDRIWATPYDSEMDGGTYCDAAERPTSPNHDAWCYVRADLAMPLKPTMQDEGDEQRRWIAAVQPHVNKPPKSEHEAGNMLTHAKGDE